MKIVRSVFSSRQLQTVVLALVISAVLAISCFATPEAPSSSDMITAVTAAMTDWNLWPFVIAFAIVGLVIFLARRAVKFVR